jgi:hypothetical protein
MKERKLQGPKGSDEVIPGQNDGVSKREEEKKKRRTK